MTALATELNEFDAHCKQVASQMARGSVVPLLGAGANLCGRVEPWTPGHTGLPSGAELAAHLADFFSFPERSRDLVRITQYVATTLGDAPLYDELHDVFAASTSRRRCIASWRPFRRSFADRRRARAIATS